jgi:hypothetical protein
MTNGQIGSVLWNAWLIAAVFAPSGGWTYFCVAIGVFWIALDILEYLPVPKPESESAS